MGLIIIKETNEYIVIRKKPGIATQTAKMGEKDLVSEVKNYLAQNGARNPYLAVINRLDQPVEGLVLFAKNEKSAAYLNKQLVLKQIEKYYIATVWGHLAERTGELEDYLLKDGKTNTSKVVKKGVPNAKLAKLRYEVIDSDKECDKVKIQLLTGRHHQIRVQFSNVGNPLVGDNKYGNSDSIAFTKSGNIRWVQLMAYRLSFIDPATKELVDIELDSN